MASQVNTSGASEGSVWSGEAKGSSSVSLKDATQEQEDECEQTQKQPVRTKPSGMDEPWYPGKVNRNRRKGHAAKEGQYKALNQSPSQTAHTFTASLRGYSLHKESSQQNAGTAATGHGSSTTGILAQQGHAPLNVTEENKWNITVVNVHKKDLNNAGYKNLEEWVKVPGHVYIGRDMTRYVPGAAGSKWQNPFKSKYDTRENCCQRYRDYILRDTTIRENGKTLLQSLHELKGKTLGCWCHPEMCHGHVLKSLVEECCD